MRWAGIDLPHVQFIMNRIEIHLYGKLRRFASDSDPRGDSIVHLDIEKEETIAAAVARLGINKTALGANIFVNGEYSSLDRVLHSGDRLGLFPDDMQLLYKWYFEAKHGDDR